MTVVPAVSERFQEAITSSYTSAARVQVYDGAYRLLDTSHDESVYLIDGSVRIDRMAATRRTLSLTMMLKDYDVFSKVLDPVNGYQVLPFHGVVFGDDDIEYLQLGAYKFASYNIEELNNALKVTLKGYDYSWHMGKNAWKTPYKIASGTNYDTAIRGIAEDRATGFALKYNGIITSEVTPDLFYSAGSSPWEAITKLAEGIGAEAYFDYAGVLCVRAVPDPNAMKPVLDLTASPRSIRIGDIRMAGEVSDTYNGVICRASAPWLLFPIEGEAWDDDPYSPTYRYGPYGERPLIIEDATVTTVLQCQVAAQAELRKVLGRTDQIDFETLVDPRIEGGVVVRYSDETTNSKINSVIQTYTVPMGGGSSQGTIKTQRRFFNG